MEVIEMRLSQVCEEYNQDFNGTLAQKLKGGWTKMAAS
jgi:hypothetical protein